MTNTVTITDLTTITQALPTGSAADLQAAFMPYFERAAQWRQRAMTIKVTNLNQTKEMREAREARLALKDIRVNAEKTRVKLKENSLRTGKAIDGMANVIKFLIAPIEEHLENQERFAERLAEQERSAARDLRECESGKYLPDFPQSVDLGAISDEEFANLLKFAKAQFEAREETARRLENERIEREKREAAEREAMRAENDRLRGEREQQVALIVAERLEREKAEQAEREDRERLQREHEAKLAAERAENERLRMEAEAKERAARDRIQAECEQQAAKEKEAATASDSMKLELFIDTLKGISIPEFSTPGLRQRVSTLIFNLKTDLLKLV
jgi:hypothetical protein